MEKYFGWNLTGATIGGILEYLSMALGYHSLTVIVMVCYVGAFVMLVMAQQPSWKASTRLSEG